MISALCESHQKAKPFFTLTQNQLVDGGYLDYLRTMYGDTIRVPTTNDAHKAFEDYLEDAGRRLKLGKLKPGEDVRRTGEGRIQVSGQVAVMQINGLLARMIVEKNPDREFFVEESFPLDWMYPQLSPHGLIMRLHRDPLSRLNYETVRKDQDEWKRFVAGMIGDWINESTTMEDICNFTERVYLQKDYQGFEGDRAYADNMEAQKTFSKLRSSIAGLYVWRMKHAGDESEKAQMQQAADLALRQAIALCPHSPEAVFRSSEFLLHLNRTEDAIRTVRTAVRLEPNDVSFQDFLKELHKRY